MKAGETAIKPKSVDHLVAASVPLAGLTAWQGLFKFSKLEKGQCVFKRSAFAAIVDEMERVVSSLPEKPIVIGHSAGGLIRRL